MEGLNEKRAKKSPPSFESPFLNVLLMKMHCRRIFITEDSNLLGTAYFSNFVQS